MRRGALLLVRHHEGGVVEEPTEATFGKKTVGGSKGELGPERERVWAYSLPVAGKVTKLTMYLEPTGVTGEQKLKGVIYTDVSGTTTKLAGATAEKVFKSSEAAGWYDLTFAAPVALEPGVYWIGVMNGNGTSDATGYRMDTVANSRHYVSRVYSEGPVDPFGAASVDSEQVSIYATYQTGAPPAEPPVNTAPPTIGGTPQETFTLTAINGSWSGSPTSRAHQWLRCDSAGNTPVAIEGATGQTYGVVRADVGHTIRVQETATNGSGTSSPASSTQTAAVTAMSGATRFTPMLGLNSDTTSAATEAAVALGAKGARAEFTLSTAINSAAEVASLASHLAAKGAVLQPIASMHSKIPSAAEVAKVKGWCEQTPTLRNIEFGNETNYPDQLGNTMKGGEEYALKLRQACELCAPFGVGVLGQASDAGAHSEAWIEGMAKAVPNLDQIVGGWTIHPYSNQHTESNTDTFGIPMLERMIASLERLFKDTKVPIDATEWGFTSNNGGELEGFHYTYSEAAKMAVAHAARLKAVAKGRLRTLCVYQAHDQQTVGAGTSKEWYFGAVNSGGGAKGAYTPAIKTILAE